MMIIGDEECTFGLSAELFYNNLKNFPEEMQKSEIFIKSLKNSSYTTAKSIITHITNNMEILIDQNTGRTIIK